MLCEWPTAIQMNADGSKLRYHAERDYRRHGGVVQNSNHRAAEEPEDAVTGCKRAKRGSAAAGPRPSATRPQDDFN